MKKSIKLIICLLIIIGIFMVYKVTYISNLERDLFLEQNKILMNYYDSYDYDTNSLDNYILYALTFSENENNKTVLTSKEIKDILEKIFDKKIDEDEITNVGITQLLLDNNIMQDYDKKEYFIDKESINVSNKKIIIYNMKSLKRRFNNYIVEYEKYEIENPYDLLNYYNNKGIETTSINNYLNKTGNLKGVKQLVKEDFLKEKAKRINSIKVKYILKGTKFLIS